jgi:phosphate transport system substrate-binding protein
MKPRLVKQADAKAVAEVVPYPITAAVFVLMCKQPRSREGAMVAMDFLNWALESGQAQAEALDYASLPRNLVRQI